MTLSDFESKRLHKLVGAFVEARRPPPAMRSQIDLSFRITGQSVEIVEVRPAWQGHPGETTEQPVAKATYVKTQAMWRVYWQRADLKWHAYQPEPQVDNIERFLTLVAEDRHACFFG